MGQYHEHAYLEETGELLEDKMFHVVRCTNATGDFIEKFEVGQNVWLTEAEIADLNKKYTNTNTELIMANGEMQPFVHEIHQYRKDEF